MTKPWMIDELAHAGPEHLDPGFVAGFDRKQRYPELPPRTSPRCASMASAGGARWRTWGPGRLHQLPDFWKVLALDRTARLLRPGGGCACKT